MANDNIFSGRKVVDRAGFIAGTGAATILSDFGADVIKVEPPEGELWRIGQKIPPQPRSEEPYPFQLANRNKRGCGGILDRKSTPLNPRPPILPYSPFFLTKKNHTPSLSSPPRPRH